MAKEKTPLSVYYAEIAKAINHDESSSLPEFPKKYYTHEISPGIRLYLRETDQADEVEYVHELTLVNEILTWIRDTRLYDFTFDTKKATEAARVWRATSKPVSKILNVCWQYDKGLTFRRLPWIPSYDPAPVFNEMFSRISNGRALKAFIGSLLCEKADMQQYVWLYGQGQNGKGSLSRFLYRILGNSYSSQMPPANHDRFWTYGILGKRLIVFPDCNNQSFVTSGLFKSLTGGDPVRVEQKNQPAATAVMNAKYLFLSNERPALSSEKADQRRIIYCEMQPVIGDPDPSYDAKLWAEGPTFLRQCIDIYNHDCEHHGPIPVKNEEALHDWVSTVEEEFETVFERNFGLDSSGYILPSAFQSRLQQLWPRNKKSQFEFINWLERTHGIRKKSMRDDIGVIKVYPGLSLTYEGVRVDVSETRQIEIQNRNRKK